MILNDGLCQCTINEDVSFAFFVSFCFSSLLFTFFVLFLYTHTGLVFTCAFWSF